MRRTKDIYHNEDIIAMSIVACVVDRRSGDRGEEGEISWRLIVDSITGRARDKNLKPRVAYGEKGKGCTCVISTLAPDTRKGQNEKRSEFLPPRRPCRRRYRHRSCVPVVDSRGTQGDYARANCPVIIDVGNYSRDNERIRACARVRTPIRFTVVRAGIYRARVLACVREEERRCANGESGRTP